MSKFCIKFEIDWTWSIWTNILLGAVDKSTFINLNLWRKVRPYIFWSHIFLEQIGCFQIDLDNLVLLIFFCTVHSLTFIKRAKFWYEWKIPQNLNLFQLCRWRKDDSNKKWIECWKCTIYHDLDVFLVLGFNVSLGKNLKGIPQSISCYF